VLENERRTQREIATIARVTEVTVRKSESKSALKMASIAKEYDKHVRAESVIKHITSVD